ncbi:MAG: type VI secretion system Vgr family protein [Telluria sp.]
MARPTHSIHDLIYGRQNNRILRLSFPNKDAPSAQFLVNRIDATESVSSDFDYTVELLSDDANIALKEMQGRLLSVELVRGDGSLRYFSGYVFSFRRCHSDGSITFYEAHLGPWLKFLSLRKDNYLFHGKNLREQTETILRDYSTLPRWEWRVTSDDPVMADACQFDESDFNYLSRRWEAAGWYYWYEHDAEGHTLIVSSDSTAAPAIDGDVEVRFQSEGGAGEEDAIDRWAPVRQVMASSVALSSFDFKDPTPNSIEIPTLNVQGDVPVIESYEYAGAYGFKNARGGDAQGRTRMEEIETLAKRIEAEGNSRFLMPGRCFKLVDHFNHLGDRSGKDEFLVLSVHHQATNNHLQEKSEAPRYRNWSTCTRKNVPWRPGRGFNSVDIKILAPQTATVVGPTGPHSIFTDEYGRIRVQFHWDRFGKDDERSSTWLRVASSWAGAELGTAAIPRVGTEVIVQWLGGCPDRPVITGALFNERNQPPWTLPTQQSLTGFRSRELAPNAGNSAGGRSNHLVLDDTNQQIQAQLKSDHQCSQISLGHITRIESTQGRMDPRGEGWEIATNAWGVARAAKGMLITTEGRVNAAGHIKDMGETVQRLAAARELQEGEASLAERNGAQEKQGQQADIAVTLKAQIDAIRGNSAASREASFPELSEPHLVLASPAGIATTTAQSTHIASDLNTALTTGKSVSIAAGDGLFASVRQTIRLFVQKAGIKFIAAAGDIDVKALSNNINVLAKLTITHTANRIVISAKEDILINGGGSYVKFSAGGIEHGTGGTFVAHAASHDFTTAASMSPPDLKTNVVDVSVKRDLHLEYVDADGKPLQHDPIQAHAWDGQQHDSTLDGAGTAILSNVSRGSFRAEQTKRK